MIYAFYHWASKSKITNKSICQENQTQKLTCWPSCFLCMRSGHPALFTTFFRLNCLQSCCISVSRWRWIFSISLTRKAWTSVASLGVQRFNTSGHISKLQDTICECMKRNEGGYTSQIQILLANFYIIFCAWRKVAS